MKDWTEIVKHIRAAEKAVIMTHTNMDGDAMGSSCALCHALRKLGKDCVILLEDEVPGYLRFMLATNGEGESLPFFTQAMPFEADVAIAVDCGDETRIENRLPVFRNAAVTLCVDHHEQVAGFADYSCVDPGYAATGLLIYELIEALGVSLDRNIAEDIYLAILTDTGCFRFSNTDALCHRVTSKLYEYGIRHSEIGNLVYDENPLPQVLLEAKIIDCMEIFAGGRAVISYMDGAMMSDLGVSYDMGGTCIDRLRKVKGVEYCAFLKENSEGRIKLSLRAKSYGDVNEIARALGGGGHIKSAGATLHMTMPEAVECVKAEIEKALNGRNTCNK